MAEQPQPQPPPNASSPPASPTSISSSEPNPTTKSSKPTSIDLWNVPAFVNPSPPTNTLLITNLHTPHIFSGASLQHLYNLLNTPVALNSFAPLPSLRRIIISYPTTEAAVATRQLLEQSASLPVPPPGTTNDATKPDHVPTRGEKEQKDEKGSSDIRPMKIYFGEPTPLVGQYASADSTDPHLQAPSLGKLMFISPPPSPPCGWEIRDEDPPNKDTHAEDLLAALAGLGSRDPGTKDESRASGNADDDAAVEGRDFGGLEGGGEWGHRKARGRRGTLTVYHPRDHGDSEDLPAVMVEDTTGEDEPGEGVPLPTRTSRPPVELMDVA